MGDQRLVSQPPLNLAQESVHAAAFAHRPAIVTEGELGKVEVQVLAAHPMVMPYTLRLNRLHAFSKPFVWMKKCFTYSPMEWLTV